MNLERTRELLTEFRFRELFVEELGWNQPTSTKAESREAKGVRYTRRMLSQLSGVAVFQITGTDGLFDRKTRELIEREVSRDHRENLCIFLDRVSSPTQSFWVWANRDRDEHGKARRVYREHTYFRGQPADLFIGKLQALVVELADLDEEGNLPVTEVARRMKDALDVERVTKKFYRDYQTQHESFIELIQGIDDESDRRWYASIVLNRLMFVWFLQKKGFIDAKPGAAHGDFDYLPNKLEASRTRGKDRFFSEFLKALFFEAFAKHEDDRSAEARQLTGRVRYLNGGLFLPHRLESDAHGKLRVGATLRIPDRAFENLFALFGAYSWNLDDTPGGKADEINPDVLGYIFEKYINQKAFGAYYTRPEITEYLCEHTIHGLILDRINRPPLPELGLAAIDYDSVPELLARKDGALAHELLVKVLPGLKLLDPAVGSGAFLVAAMKVLIGIYTAIVGKAELGGDRTLKAWLAREHAEHRNLAYAIKRRIITDNLFGVDIMEEATEIARLRLFLALIASARHEEELEPLPNIDFNVLAGNSLVGLMRVTDEEFNKVDHDLKQAATVDMFRPSYKRLLAEKNRLIDLYRHSAETLKSADLGALRNDIDAKKAEAILILNELLRDEFEHLGVKFEQATWDDAKGDAGTPKKRRITTDDVAAQRPFHWGYEFDEIMQRAGGFDAIITNPPWETFKPQAKEFFAEHSELVTKNKMTIKEFEKEQAKLLKHRDVRAAWLEYLSRFPHMNIYYRNAAQYASQVAHADGKKIVTDLNLYKLFLEQCFNLLRPGGRCGIVIPSGIYTDLGAKGLRDLLFEQTRIEGLFCFENRKGIFEGVDSRFKFVVLTFEKSAQPRLAKIGEKATSAPPDDLLAPTRTGALGTQRFPAAFMRHDVAELARFPRQGAISVDISLVKKLSPDAHSLLEFKSSADVEITKKAFYFAPLGSIDGWGLQLGRELHMTDDRGLFRTSSSKALVALYEGKMIHQFDSKFAAARYWVDPSRIGSKLSSVASAAEPGAVKLAYRSIARSTDERTVISTVIPCQWPTGHSLNVSKVLYSGFETLFLAAVLNSLVFDYLVRLQVSANLTVFFLLQTPVPRLSVRERAFKQIATRAGRLICVSRDFEALAAEINLGHKTGDTADPAERARLRAELDGLVAHLYGLTEEEFAHILTAFPLVSEEIRLAARNAYRDVEKGLIQ